MKTEHTPPEVPSDSAPLPATPPANAGTAARALSRRGFVGRVLGSLAAVPLIPAIGSSTAEAATPALSPKATQRRSRAYNIRTRAALNQMLVRPARHVANGDDARYPNRIGSYVKGLSLSPLGEVQDLAYRAYLKALGSGKTADFEAIPMGCPSPTARRKLANPQAGLAFELDGADPQAMTLPPAPEFASAEMAAEMIENYWMALTRDIPFAEYDGNPLIAQAAAELTNLPAFTGPRYGGWVLPQWIFRGATYSDLIGPYVSQFLLWPMRFGANPLDPRLRTAAPGADFLTSYPEWLSVQLGYPPTSAPQFDAQPRFIRNSRDLAQWVHDDMVYQASLQALILLGNPPSSGGVGAPLNPGNPYLRSQTQGGFVTFGTPQIMALLGQVANCALKAVWYQKWYVHRRIRPEEFGGRIHNHIVGAANYPIHRDVLNSPALQMISSQHGSFLLPQAYPEGCPLHPAYGAGHAVIAGATVTLLKAWFDETHLFTTAYEAAPDGLSLALHPWVPLTVGGELNKLASNVALGRNFGGVHWRTDGVNALRLGEDVAISVLRDHRLTFNELFTGLSFTRFDGTRVTI